MSDTYRFHTHSLFGALGLIGLVIVAVLTGMPRTAGAESFFNSLVPGAGINFYEDQDRETIIDVDGNGSLTQGDVFIGFARIDNRSLPLPGVGFDNTDVYVVFSNMVLDIASETNPDDTLNYTIEIGPTTVAGLDLGTIIGIPGVPAGSILALYEAVGTDLIIDSPGDYNEDGDFNILDFTSLIADADLDAVAGISDDDPDDHWRSTFRNVNPLLDPIQNLALLEQLSLTEGIPDAIVSFHAGLSVLVNNHPNYLFADEVPDFADGVENTTYHQLTVQNGTISGAADLEYPQGNPFFSNAAIGGTGTIMGYDFYGASSNADFGVIPFEPQLVGACRMTGGNATVYPLIGTDGLDTWSYQFEGPSEGERVTTGGQINAPSGNTPVSGHWTHTLHGGQDGTFSFHAGTSSAPAGTEISSVECADPGWCVQARCAPFKQLFWKGIGNFANQRFDYDFGSCNVTKGNRGTLHAVEVMIGDFGENDRPTRKESLNDGNPDTCDWLDKLQAAGYPGPVGPYDAADAVYLDSVPDLKFGYKGAQVCDKCPDYYQIRIWCESDLSSPTNEVIYEFAGYLGGSNPGGGNYQIHPETGEQCPADEVLVPELFEEASTTTTGKGKKNK